MSRFAGRVVLVTGAAGGFGSEMARRFAAEGALAVCADLNLAAAEALAADLPGEAMALACDVADAASVERAAAAVGERFGRVDVLVNNAALSQRPRRMANTELAEVERLFAVNVISLHHTTRHVVPLMRERGGSIINIASVTAIRPRPGMTWYNATKAAVISITHSMAAELAPDRIRVNAIAPGVSRTAMFDAMFGTPERAEAAHEELVRTFPLGRLSRPSDVAGAALYLASDDAEFVTGVVLPVDGGRLIA